MISIKAPDSIEDPFALTWPGKTKQKLQGSCQAGWQLIGEMRPLTIPCSELLGLARRQEAQFDRTILRFDAAKANTDGVLSGVSRGINAQTDQIKRIGVRTLPQAPDLRLSGSFRSLVQAKAEQLLPRKPSAESPSDSSQRPFIDSLGRPTVDFTGAPLSESVLRQLTDEQSWQFFTLQSVENLVYKWVEQTSAMQCHPGFDNLLAKRAEESMERAKNILRIQEVPLGRRAAALVLSLAEFDIGVNGDSLMLCQPSPEGQQEPKQDVSVTI